MRHFKRRITLGKQPLHHSGTLLDNVGSGSVPTKFVTIETEVGPRSTTGAPKSVQSFRSTDEICQIGDCIKYVNLFIQVAPRTATANDVGWLEWAYVCQRENDADIPITQVGNQTLGVIAKQMYRNECVYTGNIPIGSAQANKLDIQLKIPKPKTFLHIGDEYNLYVYYRSTNSADVQTDNIRVILSYFYTSYG